jgi:putative salt-induced outer membrane protein YdiY
MLRSISKVFVVICFLFSVCASAQVINIEGKRFLNDTNGWVGNADFSFALIQNTQQVLSFSNTLRIQYQKNRSRFILLNDVNFIKAGKTDFVNAGYQHFRYNYKIHKSLTLEAFTQTQYNPVLSLDFRYLIGAGPRIRLLKRERARIYAAALYMYEYDDIKNDAVSLYEHRISAYITFTFNILKNCDFVSTTFYQPKVDDVVDYRIANDSSLEIHINKHLNFKSTFNLLYDTRQPVGIPGLVYNFRNGLSVKF